jgi:hypothetical protein
VRSMGRDRWVCEEEEERRPVSAHLASKGSTASEMDTGEGPRSSIWRGSQHRSMGEGPGASSSRGRASVWRTFPEALSGSGLASGEDWRLSVLVWASVRGASVGAWSLERKCDGACPGVSVWGQF